MAVAWPSRGRRVAVKTDDRRRLLNRHLRSEGGRRGTSGGRPAFREPQGSPDTGKRDQPDRKETATKRAKTDPDAWRCPRAGGPGHLHGVAQQVGIGDQQPPGSSAVESFLPVNWAVVTESALNGRTCPPVGLIRQPLVT